MLSLLSHFYRAVAWAGVIDKNNSLQLNARDGHTVAVEALLRAGADVHALDDEALRTASWWGRTGTIKVLLEGGANVHAKDDEALRWAEQQKHTHTAALLRTWAARGPGLAPSV